MNTISQPVPQAMRWLAGGIALFALATAWVAVTGLLDGSPATPVAGLILGSALVLVISTFLASRRPILVPAALVIVAGGLVVADPDAMLRSGPLEGPFGYANATAAFFVQACIGALMLFVLGRSRVTRLGGGIAVATFGVVVFLTRSWTAAILLPVVVATALLVERARGGRVAIVASGGLFVAILALTVVIGAWGLGTDGGPVGRLVGGTISQARVVLWHEALSLIAEEPVLGVGPGRFASESSVASSDRDLRWAHNEFLQAGAESGLVGFVLAVSLFLWGFAALWLGPPSSVAVLAAAALALLGAQASVDYVLHFPAVAIAGAAVLGSGLGAQRRHAMRTPSASVVERGTA